MFFAERQQVVRFFSMIFNNDSKLLSDERSGKHTEKSSVFRNMSAESTAAQCSFDRENRQVGRFLL